MRPWSYFDSLRGTRRLALWIAYGVAAVALGVGGAYLTIRPSSPASSETSGNAKRNEQGERLSVPDKLIHLSITKRDVAGIRVQPARQADFIENIRVTGKVTLNEDRVTRLHPLVEGRVHKVLVKFGDRVEAGQVLAVIDSQQVGRSKLDLYKSQRETRLAEVNYQWSKTVFENTRDLISVLKKGVPITEIEPRFRDRPIGEYRDKLLGAYADLHKAQADYRRLADVTERGIIAGKQLLTATAARDAAQAKLAGDLEQIHFMAERNKMAAEQDLEKTRTTETVNRKLLEILGCKDIQNKDIDPDIQGEGISHYEVKTPFDGIVISKDIVLMDQVDPDTQMFSVADFSTAWVTADIYEKYLPRLASLQDKMIRFRANASPDRHFEAKVFYTGDIIGEKTRTADLRAIVKNTDGVLKPGMFVQVELPGTVTANVVQVPRTAIVNEKGDTYVFVQKKDDLYERRDVRTGRSGDQWVEILSGLKEGEQVVVAGAFAIKSELLSELIGEEE